MAKTAATKKEESPEAIRKKLVLTGADIVAIGEEAELLVGGKNYNTALISQIEGIQAPYFRAISSLAFHRVLDETKVTGRIVRAVVDREYGRIDWNDPEINQDPDFLQKFVRQLGKQIHDAAAAEGDQSHTKLRTFINTIVEGFATSPEGIDQLRKRSVMVQAAILSVDLPQDVDEAVRGAYLSICNENGDDMTPVAVRSSAAGEDSRKKAFAGLQDTYLNMVGPAKVVEAYHWDCASAYNLRSMTYRREAILDAIARAEETGDEAIAINAKQEWAIENTSLSVCMMQMINPVISGTAFSADTSTGCRGTARKDLVSIDTSYGLGEAVVGGKVTPDKLYVFQRDDGSEVVIRQMGCKDMKIVYDERGGTREVAVPELEALRWALSLSQAERVAKGVRAVSKAYGGMIMDTEFCIDANDKLWFVQARPENEELELHPTTIFMRRREVDAKAAANAEVLVEGNGASRGAGHGTVRFLRSALELNKVAKGDVLAAERTDPDMVPGMRVASAIMADVGGDTSHAAITSRELGIAAVIGIQRLDVLRALAPRETVEWAKNFLRHVEVPELVSPYVSRLATHLQLSEAELRQGLADSRRPGPDGQTTRPSRARQNMRDRQIMMYAVRYPDRLDDLRDLGADLALQSDIARQLWDKIEEWGSDEAPYHLDQREKNFWSFCRGAEAAPRDDGDRELAALRHDLDAYYAATQRQSVTAALRQNTGTGDFAADLEYLRALQETLEQGHEQS